jgi:hypothetical protein
MVLVLSAVTTAPMYVTWSKLSQVPPGPEQALKRETVVCGFAVENVRFCGPGKPPIVPVEPARVVARNVLVAVDLRDVDVDVGWAAVLEATSTDVKSDSCATILTVGEKEI